MLTSKGYHFPEEDPVVSQEVARVYHFRWPSIGWAIFTVCDATGELHVQSDWGDFAYRWSSDPKHLGHPTLTDFLVTRGGPDYVASKLCLSLPRAARQVADLKATETAWKERIIKERREGVLTAIRARSLWEDVVELICQMGSGRTEDVDGALTESAHTSPDFWEWCGEWPGEDIFWRASYPVIIIRDELLPRFLDYLRAERGLVK